MSSCFTCYDHVWTGLLYRHAIAKQGLPFLLVAMASTHCEFLAGFKYRMRGKWNKKFMPRGPDLVLTWIDQILIKIWYVLSIYVRRSTCVHDIWAHVVQLFIRVIDCWCFNAGKLGHIHTEILLVKKFKKINYTFSIKTLYNQQINQYRNAYFTWRFQRKNIRIKVEI